MIDEIKKMALLGIEPRSRASETQILSIVLQSLFANLLFYLRNSTP